MTAGSSLSAKQMEFAFKGTPAQKTAQKKQKSDTKKTKIKKTELKKAKTKIKAQPAVIEEKISASPPVTETQPTRKSKTKPATAESMAAKQRVISISEFFAKNRHLLGFDNPRKALLTAVKEAVDNSLDACEEAQILPDLFINIQTISENKFVLSIRDNGPGIVKQQVPNVFARLLYGSKFHTLRMSRGQQGIGISAAGMYGMLTTGEPVRIISRTNPNKKAYRCHVQIDTAKNLPEVVLEEECDFELPTGTSVTISLEGKYQKGRQSVDEYIAQTAIANPHATILYHAPDGNIYEYKRQTNELPPAPQEIKPHPYGVELGLLFKMARDSSAKQLSAFFKNEFSRVSPRLAENICAHAKLRPTFRPSNLTLQQAEALHAGINQTKIMAPSTDCIAPIGNVQLEKSLRAAVEADFYTACSRRPSVYRGNPFLIEAALAYGTKGDGNGNGESEKEPLMRLMRIANRVPLLYQQSACAIYKGVMEVNWRNYALSQSKGAMPSGPVTLMVHIASVWVPFTSESKEAIAHYPEIIKEIQLAIQECGRKLGLYLRKKKRIQLELAKRSYIETYLPYIGEALKDILILRDSQVDTLVTKLKTLLEKTRKI